MKKRIKALEDQIKIQCANGNWNYDPYMHGLANGLILAHHTITGKQGSEPSFLKAPRRWLRELKRLKPVVATAVKP